MGPEQDLKLQNDSGPLLTPTFCGPNETLNILVVFREERFCRICFVEYRAARCRRVETKRLVKERSQRV